MSPLRLMCCWSVPTRPLETVTAPDFPARWDAIAKVLDVATEQL